jgi:hypothetical protein
MRLLGARRQAVVVAIVGLSGVGSLTACGSAERRGGITKKDAEHRAAAGEGLSACPRPVRVECRPAPKGWRCKQFLPDGNGGPNEVTMPRPGPINIDIVC